MDTSVSSHGLAMSLVNEPQPAREHELLQRAIPGLDP